MTSDDKSTPPAGMETKNVPGTNVPGTYTPAAVVIGDHPGHAVGFEGKPGYTNTVGIGDPAPASESKSEGDDTKSTKTPAVTKAPAK